MGDEDGDEAEVGGGNAWILCIADEASGMREGGSTSTACVGPVMSVIMLERPCSLARWKRASNLAMAAGSILVCGLLGLWLGVGTAFSHVAIGGVLCGSIDYIQYILGRRRTPESNAQMQFCSRTNTPPHPIEHSLCNCSKSYSIDKYGGHHVAI